MGFLRNDTPREYNNLENTTCMIKSMFSVHMPYCHSIITNFPLNQRPYIHAMICTKSTLNIYIYIM
ncbi:unnamed protein product, partial [Vitis vinifera]|uniref:Uncharacterized protein n=1 Tax=Vitis vinifera TaxID=29760 RepID=D7TKN9_VITVI